MDTTLSTILGFLAGVVVTAFLIYWFRACFNLLSALLDRTVAGCGFDLMIFGGGLCLAGGLLIVLIPDVSSNVTVFSLYGGIVGGLALAGVGGYLMHREKRHSAGADRGP